jgi:beta-N-acetylhexosaminidase
MFVIGIQGEALAPDERLIIEQCGFGGFILFSHNCREPRQILSLCRELWGTGPELPPFIAIDQEGGRVHRLPRSPTFRPRRSRRTGTLAASWIGARTKAFAVA